MLRGIGNFDVVTDYNFVNVGKNRRGKNQLQV
jgi:hypothetical protein